MEQGIAAHERRLVGLVEIWCQGAQTVDVEAAVGAPFAVSLGVPTQVAHGIADVVNDSARPLIATQPPHLEQEGFGRLLTGFERFENHRVDDSVLLGSTLILVEHAEGGFDAEPERVLAQQRAAEAMDGAYVGAIDLPAQLVAALGCLDGLTKLLFQVVGRLVGEGDGGDLGELAGVGARRDGLTVVLIRACIEAELPEDLADDRGRLARARIGHQERVLLRCDWAWLRQISRPG